MIKIDDKWSIETDRFCFMLVNEYPDTDSNGAPVVNKKSGKQRIVRAVSYYPTLKMCLQGYCNEVLKDCTDIQDVIKKIDELNKKIDEK